MKHTQLYSVRKLTTCSLVALIVCSCGFLDPPDLIVGPGYFPTIQEAIDTAIDGDEVIVLPGTYRESINFSGKNITLRSATREELGDDYSPDYDIVANTTIDGSGAPNVIMLDSGTETTAVIRGLTITGGGTGIRLVRGSQATIEDNVIRNNSAGGISLTAASSTADQSDRPSKALIRRNIIRNNQRSWGAGIYISYFAEATIENNSIKDNTATTEGGGIAYYTHMSHPVSTTISNNEIVGNIAWRYGGGMRVLGTAATFTITNNLISGNAAQGGTHSQMAGGGIHAVGSMQRCTIHDNEFVSNHAEWRGGALTITPGEVYGKNDALMTDMNYSAHNTFSGNTATATPAENDLAVW